MSGTRDSIKKRTGRIAPARSFLGSADSLKRDPLLSIVRTEAASKRVWLVGGVLRNLALGSAARQDYDFVTAGPDPGALSAAVAARTQGTSFLLDPETLSYRVAAVFGGSPVTLDFSPVKADILSDLKSRDFTVNSMAVDLGELLDKEAPELIDPNNGADDAAKKLLRAVSSGVFDEDPLRSLRAVRLALQYGLEITADTLSLMKEKSGLLGRTSAERKRDELAAIFSAPGTPWAIRVMYSTGMIGEVLPGAAGWADVEGYGLLDHTLKTLEAAEELIRDPGTVFPGFASELERHFAAMSGSLETGTVFKLAAFLHDAGKPYCLKREDGRLRFIGHDSKGAPAVKDALSALKFSRKTATVVAGLVKEHHRVFNLALLRRPSERAKAHFFRACGGTSGVTLLCLAVADARATRGSDDAELVRTAGAMLDFYYGVYIKRPPRPLLTGSEIMKRFGVAEGPLVGEALKAVSDGVERGEVTGKKDAVELIKRLLAGRPGRKDPAGGN